jgi:hypothetical protein
MKHWIFLVIGVLIGAVGLVWMLQGLGTLTGSPMTGQKLWFAIGVLAIVVALALIGDSVRRLVRGRHQ